MISISGFEILKGLKMTDIYDAYVIKFDGEIETAKTIDCILWTKGHFLYTDICDDRFRIFKSSNIGKRSIYDPLNLKTDGSLLYRFDLKVGDWLVIDKDVGSDAGVFKING